MTIVLLTTGTRGDTQPYVALGVALAAKGHTVRVAASETFRAFVESYGLQFRPVHGDITRIAAGEAARAARGADTPLKFFRSLNRPEFGAELVAMQRDLADACEGADVVIYHPGAAVGHFAADRAGIPSILAAPFPMVPTSDYPALLFYAGPRLGRLYNRMTHKLFAVGFWGIVKGPLVRFWKERFGTPPPDLRSPLAGRPSPSRPIVVSCSPRVFSLAGARTPDAHHTGYWFLDAPPDFEPDPELVRFLAAGEPPVYVGFGSVGDPVGAERTTEIVVDALRRVGARGVLATGWNGMRKGADTDGTMLFIEGAPHDWLLPRVSVAVHHGGAGTTAAALRAGVPSVVVPFGNDQFAWAKRVHELGVGSPPLPRKRLTAENLAEAIEFCRFPEVTARAADLGEEIREERGAEVAADVVLGAIDRFQEERGRTGL